MRKTRPIIEAIKTRLEADYKVYAGKVIDPDQGDELPCVVIHYGREGDQTKTQVPRKKQVQIVVEYWRPFPRSAANPLLDMLDDADAIEAVCIQRRSVDMPDTLGGVCDGIEHSKTVIHPNDDSNLWTAQIVLHAKY